MSYTHGLFLNPPPKKKAQNNNKNPRFPIFHEKDANKWSSTFIYFTGVGLRVFWECRRKINKSVLFWDKNNFPAMS